MRGYVVTLMAVTALVLILWSAKMIFWSNPPASPTIASTVTSTPSSYQSQSSEGATTVDVTPTQLAAGKTAQFQVRFTTHSGNPTYDLKSQSVLAGNGGQNYAFVSWDGNSEGHHVLGNLTFQDLGSNVNAVTLTIKAVDGQDRTFSWSIK